MKIEVKELEPCKLEISYFADVDEILSKEKEVVNVFKNSTVSGFRKGKAPLNVVKLKYKNQIHESLKRALTEEAYTNSVFEKNLNVLGQPEIKNVTLFNDTFSCIFGVLVKPDFSLKPFDYTIPTPQYSKNVADVVAKKLEDLRRAYGNLTQYTDLDKVSMGDNVIVNYTAYIDGKQVEELTADGDLLTVGSSSLKHFDDNLIDMSLNETKQFEVTMDSNVIDQFKNKTINFTVTLVGGSKVTPCALDDSLAIKLGKENYNELHLQVSALANSTVELEKRQLLIDAVGKHLINDYEFVIPEWMTIPDAKSEAHRANINWDEASENIKTIFLKKANDMVKLSLILDKIRTEEPDAQLSDKEIYESVRNTLLAYSKATEENIDQEMKKIISSGEFRVLAARLLDENTFDFLLKKVKFVD